MEEGQVRMKLAEGATVMKEQINDAETDAGFTALEIWYPKKERVGSDQTEKRK